jgi:antitoxin HigA-1
MAMHNPPHPGEFVYFTYMEPFGLSCSFLASKLGVNESALSRILKQQSGVNPEMALRLSAVLGRSPESWLALQDAYDLWQARQRVNLGSITKLELQLA